MKRLWTLIPLTAAAILLDSFLFPNLSQNGIRPLFVLAVALGAVASYSVQDGIVIALVGGLITMLGLFLALYVLPERVWAIRAEDGTWTMYGISKKRGTLYREAFLRAVTGETNP